MCLTLFFDAIRSRDAFSYMIPETDRQIEQVGPVHPGIRCSFFGIEFHIKPLAAQQIFERFHRLSRPSRSQCLNENAM
jgi:hypothetical protein